jgi:hypothetical protein
MTTTTVERRSAALDDAHVGDIRAALGTTGYLGMPKIPSAILAAGVIVAAAFTGSFRRFERIAVAFCLGSLLLVPTTCWSTQRSRRWRRASSCHRCLPARAEWPP